MLGEFFRCKWVFADGKTAYYICEQVSHHPPISAYVYASPENNLLIKGDAQPKSKFLGNSAATLMHGSYTLTFTNLNEEYHITLPNLYARGILFGTMYMELGDTVTIECKKTDLICEIEFKTKSMFYDTFNRVSGKIKNISKDQKIFTIDGKWTESIEIQDVSTKSKRVIFDVNNCSTVQKKVIPEQNQEAFESQM